MKRLILTALVIGAAALLCAAPVIGAGDGGRGQTSGTVAIGRSHDGAILEAAALAPGRPATGEIRVWNAGTLPARFTLTAEVGGDAALAGAIRLRVAAAAGRVLYDGPLAAFGATSLGTFAPGDGETIRLRATLPAPLAAGLDGLTLTADFRWSATQV